MGTTRTALRSEAGIELGYVLCISGYPFLLSDHPNPTPSNIGWGATDWAAEGALPNLSILGSMSQSLEPWSNELSVPHFTFTVLPDPTDQFGIDMFKEKPGIRSELTTSFDSSDHAGGFNVVVKNAAQFAADTPIYVGNETLNVTGTPSGNNIAIAANESGYWHVFSGDVGTANRFPGKFELGSTEIVGAHGNKQPVYVSDSPASWVGKTVGLYVHRIVNGVWDAKAQAELLFAGTISSIGEGGAEDLETVVECEGIQKTLLDTVLLQDQWTAKIEEGYTFVTGDFVNVGFEKREGTGVWGQDQFVAGTDFTAAKYTAAEFGSLLAGMLDQSTTIGVSGSAHTLRWSAGVTSSTSGPRFYIKAQEGAVVAAGISIGFSNLSACEYFGFNVNNAYASDNYHWQVVGPTMDASQISLVATNPHLITPHVGFADGTMSLTVSDPSGTFVDHTSLLPPVALEHVGAAQTWSYYTIDNKVLFLGRRLNATTISEISATDGISTMSNAEFSDALRKSAAGDNGIVKQVYFAADSFQNTVARLFASTDGNGRNHATHDVLPWGAAIPWEILGTAFTDSLANVEQAGVEDSIALLIEKPTRLWDAIKSDFAMRMAMPVWKDGGIVIAQFTTPNASTSDWTLDETNKSDEKRTSTQYSSAYLAHTLKVDHSRSPLTDKFTDHYVCRNITGYQGASGNGVTKTIKARNSYAAVYGTGASVEALADMLSARFLTVLSKPLKIFKRSIPHTLFHMAPGDTVDFTDDFIRSPDTGKRGVSVRAGVIVGVRWSFGISSGGGKYFGECDIMYTEEDRLFVCAPSAEMAYSVTSGAYTNGYDAATDKMLVLQSAFTDAAASNDSSHFTVGDEIRLTAMDPADPTAAATHTDVIASITEDAVTNYDAIELTTGFTPTAGITYLITFDAYDQVGNEQKLYAYQADDADGKILDLIDPNLMSDSTKLGATTADLTELPSRHSNEMFGDGEAVSAHFVRQQIRMSNNLTNYKCAPHMPMMQASGVFETTTAGEEVYEIVRTYCVPIHGGVHWLGGRKRVFKIAPRFSLDATGTGTAYVKVTSSANPPKGTTDATAAWFGPINTITFTSTSTTAEIATTQDLEIVRSSQFYGFTFITVEAGDETVFRGLSEFWLGPLE